MNHPDFPIGTMVRDRMNHGRGIVALSHETRVMVQWHSPARFVGDFDGWQIGNNVYKVACGPTRATLEDATGLLPVDHPQLWSARDLVTSANRRHYARIAGEAWAQS